MKIILVLAGFLALSACSQNKPDVRPQDEPSASPAASSTAKPAKPCQTAKDCHGATPKFCVQCPAGTSGGCAHWACVDGGCQIKTCE